MQLFALDKSGSFISAAQGDKQCDYTCLECGSIVRLRRGIHRREHFYHLNGISSCRMNGKSLIHLNVQCLIQSLLPQNEAQLEVAFPEIKRVADVVWEAEKLIYEVQCSPITREEVLQRNLDYHKLGYQVVWILHDNRYNRSKVSSAELALVNSPYYYTNLDREGKGIIYDQFSFAIKGLRRVRLAPVSVSLSQPIRNPKIEKMNGIPVHLQIRSQKWSVAFGGDLVHACLELPMSEGRQHYLFKAINEEKKHFPLWYEKRLDKIKRLFVHYLIRPYRVVFQILLEKAAR